MNEQTFQLGDIRGIVRRRWRLVAAAAASGLLLALFLSSIIPNRYVAHTTMLIEPQAISKRLVEGDSEATDLINRLHLMTMQILSRPRLSKVIDDLGLYTDLSDEKTREEVIEYMRAQIWVEPVLPELQEGTTRRNEPVAINTFQLFFRNESPRRAADVANRLSNDFIDEHIRERVRVAGDTAEFIEAELGRLTGRLREVESQIAQVKQEGAGSLPEDRDNNERLLGRAMDALNIAQRGLAEAQSDQAFYRQQATAVRASEGRRGDDVVGKAVSPALRLQELEMMLGEMQARGFTDKHPDVVKTRAEMEQLQARVDSDDPTEAPTSVAEQEARAQAERAATRAETEQREIERLEGEIRQLEERIARTPAVAERLGALAGEYESLTKSFGEFSSKRVEATVAANMERRQKGEQFRVLEPAVTPPNADSPNRPLILVLGLFVGLALGVALAFLLEVSDTSIHDARGLQERLRIPVLASVPAILLGAERMAQRRKQIREAIAAAVVAGAVMAASVVGYLYVNRSRLFGGEERPAAEAPATAAAPGAAPAPAAAAAPAPAGAGNPRAAAPESPPGN
ncbi:MAG: hypothetical protein OZ948_14680 [Deltaproteobacteria bacterium]|nr:hypothetical protein [Deltaproteobacteria bacterium]